MSELFSAIELHNIAIDATQPDRVRRLAAYALELRCCLDEVLADDYCLLEDGFCYEHDPDPTDDYPCSHQKGRSLLGRLTKEVNQ